MDHDHETTDHFLCISGPFPVNVWTVWSGIFTGCAKTFIFIYFFAEVVQILTLIRDKQLIKVVTGIRRYGKSTLFEIYQEYLRNNGVDKDLIIAYNLEDGEYADIEDHKALYDLVKSSLLPDKMNYIFLDEVQRVENFQKAVDSLFIKKTVMCISQVPMPFYYLVNWKLCYLGAMWK